MNLDIIDGYAKINLQLFPFSLVFPLIFAPLSVFFLFASLKNSKKYFTIIFKVLIILQFIFIGILLLYATLFINFLLNFPGIVLMWTIAGLLIYDLKREKIIIQMNSKFTRFVSFLFIFTSLFVYPLIQLISGHLWPRFILLGAGACPTTIFLIGVLILSIPKTNKIILGLTSMFGVISGFIISLLGVFVDFLFMGAGIAGIVFLIKYWNKIE